MCIALALAVAASTLMIGAHPAQDLRTSPISSQSALAAEKDIGDEAHPRAKPTPRGVLNALVVEGIPSEGAATRLDLFTSADTSSVTRMKDGRIVVAYQGFPEADARDFNRTTVRFSKDDGRTWTDAAPIVIDGLDASLAPPFDPALVALPDGRVRLYFISYVARGLKPGAPPTATEIYSAVSTDGVRYAFEPGVRFTVAGRVVLDAAAALHAGVFHLIVPDNGTAAEFIERRTHGEAPPGGNGYHAVSKDGLAFERVADLALPSTRNRWWGNLLSDGNALLFFGTGPGPWPIESSDGMQWKVADKPVAMPGVDPAVIRVANLARDGEFLVIATKEPSPSKSKSTQTSTPKSTLTSTPGSSPAAPRTE